MANDNKEICEIVKKCKILLLDIEGTTTSISFVKEKLFPYAEENVKQFLDTQWETDDVKEVVAALRKLALEDQEKSVDGVVVIPGEDASKEDQIEGLVNNVKWQMSSDRKAGALKQLQGLIWKQGYDNGDIKGHVYDDVSAALEQWHSVDGQKVYIYSSGSVQAQKLLFGQSLAGDLLRFIDGHFDTAVGAKQEAASYTAIAEKIGVQPADVLFLTDIPKEAEAARVAGFHVALVSREGNAPLPSEATDAYAVLHSLAQLTASNKRKTEPQDEQPAKVPKTNSDDDVKTAAVPDEKNADKKVQDEQEKMEVEEIPAVQKKEEKEKKVDETIDRVETIIEDVTDSIETLDVPMVDIEPVVIETDNEKSDIAKGTNEMDTEITESMKSAEVVIKSDEVAVKPEVTKTDKVKPDGEITNLDEAAAKPNDEVLKSDVKVSKSEEVPKTDEVITKEVELDTMSDEVPTKDAEVLKSTEISLSNENKETLVETKLTENKSQAIGVENKEEPIESKDEKERQGVKEKAKVAEETPPVVVTEIDEITAENLGDVAEMIDDLVPIVEEPPTEDMEDLQNVGEVLEKECDEILSKVQDVTNLDSIPLKPLLNPIAEETMETEIDADNTDSNDIVDRILDTELELEMKQCNDIDLNTVSEITDDAKIEESVGSNLTGENADTKLEDKVNNKELCNTVENMDTESSQPKPKTDDNIKIHDKVDCNEKNVTVDMRENTVMVESNDKMDKNDETESKETVANNDNVECSKEKEITEKLDKQEKVQDNEEKMETNDKVDSKDTSEKTDKSENTDVMESNEKVEEIQILKVEESKTQPSGTNKDDVKMQAESKDTEMVSEEGAPASEKDKESQVNGKAPNGNAENVNVNGDVSNAEALNSRLSVENGKEAVNGSNGDSVDAEKAQGDKVEAEVSDIKVKTVATEEPRTDPIEQPTEA